MFHVNFYVRANCREIAFLASGLAEVQSKRVARRLIVEEHPGRQSHCDDRDSGGDDRVGKGRLSVES
jgi:hypothetical protein